MFAQYVVCCIPPDMSWSWSIWSFSLRQGFWPWCRPWRCRKRSRWSAALRSTRTRWHRCCRGQETRSRRSTAGLWAPAARHFSHLTRLLSAMTKTGCQLEEKSRQRVGKICKIATLGHLRQSLTAYGLLWNRGKRWLETSGKTAKHALQDMDMWWSSFWSWAPGACGQKLFPERTTFYSAARRSERPQGTWCLHAPHRKSGQGHQVHLNPRKCSSSHISLQPTWRNDTGHQLLLYDDTETLHICFVVEVLPSPRQGLQTWPPQVRQSSQSTPKLPQMSMFLLGRCSTKAMPREAKSTNLQIRPSRCNLQCQVSMATIEFEQWVSNRSQCPWFQLAMQEKTPMQRE